MPLAVVLVGLCVAMGLVISRKLIPHVRPAYVSLYLLFGLLISAASHFHLGLMANVTGLAALIIGFLISVVHFRGAQSS
jgi:hypothetical protein